MKKLLHARTMAVLWLFMMIACPIAYAQPEWISVNTTRNGFPNPLESDPGWGGGTDVWDILDGFHEYPAFDNGLAFTGGSGPFGGAPAGPRQATIDFGAMQTFDEAVLWHHGDDDVPAVAALDYWDGTQWQEIKFIRDFDADFAGTPGLFGSKPDSYNFRPVTASKIRYSFDNAGSSFFGNPMRHGWIYEFDVFRRHNIALNTDRQGFPTPLESDAGWGGGTDVWDILDGQNAYEDFANGLAFTGGSADFGGLPAGVRQATIDFGQPTRFDKVIAWHHGGDDVPQEAQLEFWDGTQWQGIQFERLFDPDFVGTAPFQSDPDLYVFPAVLGSKVRYSFDNSGQSLSGNPIRHGWIFQFDVFEASAILPAVVGDFNRDNLVDLLDIDLLGMEIAGETNGGAFDLTSDGLVNLADLDRFLGGDVIGGGNKLNGDANFNGKVDFADFLIMSGNFGQADKKWSEGDFVPNGLVEFEDFLVLAANFGSMAGPAQPVPEPDGVGLFLGLIAAATTLRRRSRRPRGNPVSDVPCTACPPGCIDVDIWSFLCHRKTNGVWRAQVVKSSRLCPMLPKVTPTRII